MAFVNENIAKHRLAAQSLDDSALSPNAIAPSSGNTGKCWKTAITSDAISRYRIRLFPAGSVLIPKSGASINLNQRAMLGCDAYVVSHLAIVAPKTERLLPEYLYFWSLAYDPRSQAQTTSLPSLPLLLIKRQLQLRFPPKTNNFELLILYPAPRESSNSGVRRRKKPPPRRDPRLLSTRCRHVPFQDKSFEICKI